MTTFDELKQTDQYKELAQEAEHGSTRVARAVAAEQIRRLRLEHGCPADEPTTDDFFKQIARSQR